MKRKDIVVAVILGAAVGILIPVALGLIANRVNAGVWLCGNGIPGDDPCLGGPK